MNGIEMIHDEDSHAKQGLANETDDPSKARQVSIYGFKRYAI